MFITMGIISVQVDEAEGHPGGESEAGFIALFGMFGSIGFALVFAVVGAIIGAIAGRVSRHEPSGLVGVR
jgi:hypothetical protein